MAERFLLLCQYNEGFLLTAFGDNRCFDFPQKVGKITVKLKTKVWQMAIVL